MYNFYTDEIIEEVRINNDIVDVISEYIKLEKKGKDYFGLCPFHKEKTPSFSVVPGKQIFYCFGCGKGGNVIQFVMNSENLDFIEAVKFLADRAKIQLPEGESQEEQEKARLKQEIIKINTEAARYFFNVLNSSTGEKARLYLKNRRLGDQTLRRFGMGFSPEDWDGVYKHLLDKGFNEQAVFSSGLILRNKNGGYYDRFRGRIMFPIFDIRGNVIGFGGRVMDNSLPKYMNSPETPVYNKGRNLYAMNLAKTSGQKRLVIVEGYMDVISLHQCGIINTVASLGTALTESQGRILKKYAEEIIISYDADTAGQAATMRGLDLLNDIGCHVKVLIVPEGKDPDEFVRKNGPDAFRGLMDEALSLIEYKVMILKKQINTESIEGKINFLNKLADLLVKVENGIEREMYVKKLAREYSISEESILSEIFRRTRPKNSFRNTAQSIEGAVRREKARPKDSEDEKLMQEERLLLALLCTDNTLFKTVKSRFSPGDFLSEANRKVAELVYLKLEENKGIVEGELFSILEAGAAAEFAAVIQKQCNFDDNNKAVLDIIKRIEIYKLTKRKQEIFEILKSQSEMTEGDVEKLKLELKTLLTVMKRI